MAYSMASADALPGTALGDFPESPPAPSRDSAGNEDQGREGGLATIFPRTSRFLHNLALRKAALMDELLRRNAGRDAIARAGSDAMRQDMGVGPSADSQRPHPLIHSFSSDLERPPPHLSHRLQSQAGTGNGMTYYPASPGTALSTYHPSPPSTAWGADRPQQFQLPESSIATVAFASSSSPESISPHMAGSAGALSCALLPDPTAAATTPATAAATATAAAAAAVAPDRVVMLDGLLHQVVQRQKSVSHLLKLKSTTVTQDGDPPAGDNPDSNAEATDEHFNNHVSRRPPHGRSLSRSRSRSRGGGATSPGSLGGSNNPVGGGYPMVMVRSASSRLGHHGPPRMDQEQRNEQTHEHRDQEQQRSQPLEQQLSPTGQQHYQEGSSQHDQHPQQKQQQQQQHPPQHQRHLQQQLRQQLHTSPQRSGSSPVRRMVPVLPMSQSVDGTWAGATGAGPEKVGFGSGVQLPRLAGVASSAKAPNSAATGVAAAAATGAVAAARGVEAAAVDDGGAGEPQGGNPWPRATDRFNGRAPSVLRRTAVAADHRHSTPGSRPGSAFVPLTQGQSWWAKSTVARELVFLRS